MDPNWGMLQKSTVDDETIEEAIDRIVAAHNADAESHLGVGESLQSHKASEIIDHLASSIIQDKIADQSVGVSQLYRDKLLIQPSFESLDAWGQIMTGVDAGILITPGACRVKTGYAVGSICTIYIEGIVSTVAYDKNPFFQATIDFSNAPEGQDVAVGVGDSDPWGATDFFGFRWDATTEKMYCYYVNDGAETNFEIVGYSSGSRNFVRGEMSDNGDTIKFYLNGVLIKTFTSVGSEMDADIYFAYSNKTLGTNMESYISDVIFVQDK